LLPYSTHQRLLTLDPQDRYTGRRLENPVLETESRVTVIDGALAAAVLFGVMLNVALGWWWGTRSPRSSSSSTGCAGHATPGPRQLFSPQTARTLGRVAERSASLLHRAAGLCGATVTWNLLVGGAAVATAVATGSLSLIGFGVNAVVDSSVSALLVWRFRAEAGGRTTGVVRAERIALRLAAAAFSLIALYVFVRAVLALSGSQRSSSSLFGVAEAAGSLVVLSYLAAGKYRLSQTLGSRALRADSLLTASGVALAAIALAGLVAQRAFGWWWADPVAGLGIAIFLGWQGLVALRDAQEQRAVGALAAE
jgi:divalent metal cation (Fe/Co/Zn/Cd) transporter